LLALTSRRRRRILTPERGRVGGNSHEALEKRSETMTLRRGLLVLLIALSILLPSRVSKADNLGYYEIKADSKGHIVPCYSEDPANAYDFVVRRVWDFWKNMKTCPNGVKYYMQHQVWADPGEDSRGLGGDQIPMALSSWSLLYPYLGDRSVIDNMIYMADYWLDHGLSPADAAWPNLPYPYNTELHSGIYDGDMRAGKGFLQPDKAASFGAELVTLYRMTGNSKYLKAALAIADTLSRKIETGDNDRSPWPYRVHALSGQVSMPYTANYTGALRLFHDLAALKEGNSDAYANAYETLSAWLKAYPLKTNKWGPFFEDISGWSNTEINADTMAWYILENPEWDPNWQEQAHRILAWSRATFANQAWVKYGVTAINEQTAYTVPGNSHTSRHASVQVIYAEKTGDQVLKPEAVRQLNWATYMVGEKGNNRYPLDDIWLTDGYGDYVRHYLRAMGAAPELAPAHQNHLLKSTSVVRDIAYAAESISYQTSDASSVDLLRLTFEPGSVVCGGKRLSKLADKADLAIREGYTFNAAGDVPGVLRVRHGGSPQVVIVKKSGNEAPVASDQSMTVPAAVRSNLARLPGVRLVVGQERNPAHFPSTLNDGDLANSVSVPVGGGIGVLWASAQTVRQVLFHQGIVEGPEAGYYARGVGLEITDDGRIWRKITDFALLPAPLPEGKAASLADFLFTLPQAIECRGIRIVGEAEEPGGTAARALNAREIEVFGDPVQATPIDIEYLAANATVAEGQTAAMGVRLRKPGFQMFQWEVSRDSGRTWSAVPRAYGPYFAVKAETRSGFDGNQYRCAVSNGIQPTVFSKPVTLTVKPADGGEIHTSNAPLKGTGK